MAQELEVDSDLVSATCERPTPHHTGAAVVAQSLEHCLTGFAPRIYTAHPYLVRYYQDGFLAGHFLGGELPLYPAHILLFQLHRREEGENQHKTKLMKPRPTARGEECISARQKRMQTPLPPFASFMILSTLLSLFKYH